MSVLFAVQEIVKSTNPDVTLLQWAELVVVPLIIGFLGYLGVKTSSNAKKAATSAIEAAESVRPNGTGHRSQTAMIEDVLLHVGELRGDVKAVAREIDKHITSEGHPEAVRLAKEANLLSKETHLLLSEVIKNSNLFPGDTEG